MMLHRYLSEQVLLVTGAVILLLTAWFSEGFNHFDEHCQVIEFAGFTLGLTDTASLPWEHACQMRPAIQPVMVVGIYRMAGWVGMTDPFIIAFLTRLLAASVSFFSILIFYRAFRRQFEDQSTRLLFLILSLFIWFSVYNSVRFSSETMAGRIFILGVAFHFLRKEPTPYRFLITGFLMGLAFLFRYQAGLLVAGFGAWLLLINRPGFRSLAAFTGGVAGAVGLGLVIDRWYYGQWVVTWINYFSQNLVEGKAAAFGVSPWWYYITETFLNAIPPFSLIFILPVFVYILFRPADAVTWSVVPFLAGHFLIAHKEIRFMFPLIGLLPLMIAFSMVQLRSWCGSNFTARWYSRFFTRAFWIINFAMVLLLIFRPADDQISLYRKIYYHYKGPTVLWFTDENPFRRAKVELNFYKRNNLIVREYQPKESHFPGQDTTLLMVTGSPVLPAGLTTGSTLRYSSFPPWIRHFNINNWVERTYFWYLYEIKPSIREP